MTELNSTYWNARYSEGTTAWDLGAVSTPLKTYFDQLEDLSVNILIPGAGNAHEAEYLLGLGFKNVYVCDFAQLALDNLKKRVPGINPNHLLQTNFFELKDLSFDFIIEQTFFCALDPALRQKYFIQMQHLLKPNGHLVGLLFDDVLNTDRPPFGGNTAEYKAYFENLFQVKKFEPCYNSIAPRAGREIFMELIKPEI